MANLVEILTYLCYGGALVAGAAYIYGYILRSKGDRRWNTAGLLFAGLALANAPPFIEGAAERDMLLNAGLLVVFMLLGLTCQAVTALKGRRSDRRGDRRAPRETVAPASQG